MTTRINVDDLGVDVRTTTITGKGGVSVTKPLCAECRGTTYRAGREWAARGVDILIGVLHGERTTKVCAGCGKNKDDQAGQ